VTTRPASKEVILKPTCIIVTLMSLKEILTVVMFAKNAMTSSGTKVHCRTIFAINQKKKLKSRCSSAQSVIVFIIIALS
jgi:hypothetical protein